MSLIVSANAEKTFDPIPEGPCAAICFLLVDLGLQVNKKFNSVSKKVQIGWEIPGETYKDKDGNEQPRTIFKEYSLSFNEKSNLRKDLRSWRGRDFTPEELDAFDLKNIVGIPCMLNIIHTEGTNGKIYANVGAVMPLMKGMEKPKLSGYKTIFDMDADPLEKINTLPEWIAEKVKASETYMDRAAAQISEESAAAQGAESPVLEPLDDGEGEIPF